jgi:hypothetical protein
VNWWDEFLSVVQENAKDPEVVKRTPEELNQIFKNLPYSFDPERKTRNFYQSINDKTAACAEAAAAIAASLSVRNIEFEACYKFDDLTKAAHIVIIANGRIFDPYQNFFPTGVSCVSKPKFFSL